MNIQFEKASLGDINDLVQVRIDYLLEDYGRRIRVLYMGGSERF